jgi:5-methylcytosine-specific restriction endonuclease McrA
LCFAEYFRARGDLHRDQSRAAKKARVRALQAYVLEFLQERGCVDCGENDPVVLEFDHIRDKTATIARLVGEGVKLDVVKDEISRCEVVCVNCHRRRTARRGRWRRADPSELPKRSYPSASVARNVAHLDAILARSACLDCGERNPLVLDFDHVGPKRGNVTRLAWFGHSLETIAAEIERCEIRCANCHRRVTAERGGHFRFRALSSSMPP